MKSEDVHATLEARANRISLVEKIVVFGVSFKLLLDQLFLAAVQLKFPLPQVFHAFIRFIMLLIIFDTLVEINILQDPWAKNRTIIILMLQSRFKAIAMPQDPICVAI
jgi:hypothetical protein